MGPPDRGLRPCASRAGEGRRNIPPVLRGGACEGLTHPIISKDKVQQERNKSARKGATKSARKEATKGARNSERKGLKTGQQRD